MKTQSPGPKKSVSTKAVHPQSATAFQNGSSSQIEYANGAQNLSAPKNDTVSFSRQPSIDNPNPDRFEPVEIGVNIHFAEIDQLKILGFLASVLDAHRRELLTEVVLKMPDAHQRITFVQALVIAEVVCELQVHVAAHGYQITDSLADDPRFVGIFNLWRPTLEDSLVMIAGELVAHFHAIARLAQSMRPGFALDILNALHAAVRLTHRDSEEAEKRFHSAALVLQQYSLQADTWALLYIEPNISRAKLDKAIAALPRKFDCTDTANILQCPTKRAKAATLNNHVAAVRKGETL